ncbi:MAG: ABC transporter permease [Anaerolineae bacterium]|nr:ABC transporter permease [Anaerolineae bacterium]
MNFLETIRIALTALLTNRLRSVLTTLGIIIGVAAVIGLVSLGRGVESFIAGQFEALGSNVLFVFSSPPASGTRTTIQPITTVEGDDLSNPSIAPSILQIAMEYQVLGTVAAGSNRLNIPVSGVSPNFQEVRNWKLRVGGAFITESDIDSASRVAVVGTTVVERLFGDKTIDPVGRILRINDRVFTIVGVLEERSSSFFGDENDVVFIPLSTAQTRLSQARTKDGGFRVDVLHIQAVSKESMESAKREIERYLTEAHDIQFQGEQDFQIINQADLLTSLGRITGILTIFLGMIAGISLLVGGIGIMNIMLVSVTERTREIGLRKAVGARGRDILTQFLIESMVLSFVGGVIGILIGGGAAILGGRLLPQLQLSLSLDAVLLATVVSSFVGIFFGLYPASRAARMRPIDALRFE